MDHRKLFENGKSENTPYDINRAKRIKLGTFSYGVPKFDLGGIEVFPGTCEKCVFGSGEHSASCDRLE
jgi:hypothetical protein